MQTRVLTAHVPIQLAKSLDKAAAKRDRSRSWIVQKALTDWLEREGERERLTREALADVDAGRTVKQKEIEHWARQRR